MGSPVVFNVKDYGVTGDGKLKHGSVTYGSGTVTSTFSQWVQGNAPAGDVGKTIRILQGGQSGATLVAQIGAVASDGKSITLANNVTVQNPTPPQVASLLWGTDDSVAIASAYSTAAAAGGGIVSWPAGIYLGGSTIVSGSGVYTEGSGSGFLPGAGKPFIPSTTTYAWVGGAAPMVYFGSALDYPNSGDPSFGVNGIGWKGIFLDASVLASEGARFDKAQYGPDLQIVGGYFPAGGILLRLIASTLPSQPNPDQPNQLNRLLRFVAVNGNAPQIIKMEGPLTTTGDTTQCSFYDVSGIFGADGLGNPDLTHLAGIEIINADFNTFFHTFLFRQTGANGPGVRLGQRARNNYFYSLYASTGGLEVVAPDFAGTYNVVREYQRSDNAPPPNVLPGATLVYEETGEAATGSHFKNPIYIDGNQVSTYTLRRTIVLPAAGSSYSPTTGTQQLRVRMVGGGGGGGSLGTSTAISGSAGGGGAGGYCEKLIPSPLDGPYTYVVGVGGAGGDGGNNNWNGHDGTNTTFNSASVSLTATGGGGGLGTTSASAQTRGGAGGAVASGGDLNTSGAPGGNGTIAFSGAGASTSYGGGGRSLGSAADGNSGTGYGSGGGGAKTATTTTGQTGGSGANGLIIVEEWG